MTTSPLAVAADRVPDTAAVSPVLDIVVPVHNEAVDLAAHVVRLRTFLDRSFPFPCRVTIVDNGSVDDTPAIATELASQLDGVCAVVLPETGRGRALRAAWSVSAAPVLAYMDVDLSTDLAALHPLVAPLLSGHSDLAIGTRLSPGASVVRGPKREILSRGYNAMLRATFAIRFSDAQCGFKAVRAECARTLLPLIRDDAWFFDTEMLVLAESAGLRIHEVPVDWVDDPDSRVDIMPTVLADLRGISRLARDLATGRLDLSEVRRHRAPAADRRVGLSAQLLRFALIGVLSTAAYIAVYVLARTVLPPQAANAVALLMTAVANTAANRRWTFGTRGRLGLVRHHAQGLAVFVAALLVTAGSLAVLHAVAPAAGRPTEVAVLVVANLVATGLRFVALRGWVFRTREVS